MSGESRYAWQHYIPHRKYDDIPGAPEPTIRPPTRVSITLRRVCALITVDFSFACLLCPLPCVSDLAHGLCAVVGLLLDPVNVATSRWEISSRAEPLPAGQAIWTESHTGSHYFASWP